MAINFGDVLGGLGAAYGGRAQEYAQGIQQREQGLTERKRAELEARQKAMYQDGYQAFQMLSDGNIDGIISLANDRLEMLSTFQDADPSDTLQVLKDAEAAKAGDPMAIRNLSMTLSSAAQTASRMGLVPQQAAPEEYTLSPGEIRYRGGEEIASVPFAPQDPAAAEEYSPGITRFRNGVAVQYGRQGGVRVVDEQGRLVTGPDAETAIQRGQASGISEAGQIAAEQVQGRGSSERAQSIINNAVDAIGQFPVLTNAIGLLDEVKTGGFSSAAIKARSMFGIESGDEGELSYLLATNVLQQLRPIFGAAFTASEGERLTSISAAIGRSPETNRRLLGEALRIARSAAERGLYRAQDANDDATVRELENALNELYQFEGGASTTQGGAADIGNPDLFNRADSIVGGL